MAILQTVLTVRSDEVLERAIASETTNDADITESFLQEMSSDYPARKEVVV